MPLPPIIFRRSTQAALAVAVGLASARGEAVDRATPAETWTTGRPVRVEVRDGRAAIDIPPSPGGSQTLVIVSALSKGAGPFPIRLDARPSERARTMVPSPAIPARPAVRRIPPPSPPHPAVTSMPPVERTFHLLARNGDVASASSYLAVAGRLRALGRRVQVYVDPADLDAVDAETLRDLVTTFDEKVFPTAAARFGPALDVDGDGRFTVLMSGWLGRMAGGKVSVDGFARGADLDVSLGAPFGNRCDMVYLNAELKAGPHLRTVLAHEYTHAITFCRKALPGGVRGPIAAEEEGWLDEGLAHLVEDAFGFSRSNIDYRVSAFLTQPERYRLVVNDYFAADLFRSHGNRGATYLFLRWCVDRHGSGLLDALIRSDLRGVENLEAATGSSFADLFRGWTVALYLSGLDPTAGGEGAHHYRSVDPRGVIDDWVLAGPRASVVAIGGPGEAWSAAGTSAHFSIVSGTASGPLRVEIEGPPGAELQVTAVPLPAGLARPELTVRPSRGTDGSVDVRARVVERQGADFRLGALAWEPVTPASNSRAGGFRRGGLDLPGIAAAFGTAALPPGGVLRSGPIRLEGVRPGTGPLVFKVVGTDAQGRKVAAWAVVEPSKESEAFALDQPEKP